MTRSMFQSDFEKNYYRITLKHAFRFVETFHDSHVNASLQESKLYGAHFKEITADAPKSKKITFDDSDEE